MLKSKVAASETLSVGRDDITAATVLRTPGTTGRSAGAIVDDVAHQVVGRWTCERLDAPLDTAMCAIRFDRQGRRLIVPTHATELGPRLRHLYETIAGHLDQPETEPLDIGWSQTPGVVTDVSLLPRELADASVQAGLCAVRRWNAVGSKDDAVVLIMFTRSARSLSGPIADLVGDAVHLLDATLQQQVEQRMLRAAAEQDPLTALHNRLGFDRTMERVRSSDERDIGCVYVDIDHFKSINDTWGHRVGDSILSEVASRISDVCRDADVVARLGGDEFAVLLADTTPDEVVAIAERLVHAIARPFEGVGPDVVTASVGVSFGPAERVLDDADEALYASKRAGRNQAIMAPAAR
ncbi:MAG: GGDEF domain-containing protein [Actinomycetota bacterium]